MGCQKDLITMKKGIYLTENQEENLFNILQNSVKWQILQILLKSYTI